MSIYLGEGKEYSDMQGPCPDGFHVPLITEWEGLKTIMDGLGLTIGDNWRINLHMPFAGNRDYSTADLKYQDSYAYYWSSSPSSSSSYPEHARRLYLNSSYVLANNIDRRANGFPVRCFKDSFELPTSSWTVITGTLGGAGIFRNQTDGLISITSDGTTGYTIQDKNLGATTVYNNGDTLTQANMGNMYQWGNNYGFSSTGSVTTSSTRVNAQNYGPGNYYSGSTFIKGNNDWSSVQNDNLRGGVSQGSGKKPGIKEIYLGEGKTVIVSDMQGPCDDGFHVPTKDEFQGLINTLSSIGYSGYNNIKSYLKLPPAGYYSQRGSLTNKGSTMGYWTCSPNGSYSYYLESSSSYTGFYGQGRCYGATIRPFKDEFIIPDSTWTVILGTIGSSGVFWNQNDGIISVTSNGTTGYTIADKNLGATTVYDNGTATDANCGSYFQWGNNYGFPSSGITTSSSQVNASTYGPGNYYSSSTFIAYASNPYNWDNSNNTNLRGGVSQGSSSRIEPNAKEVYIGTTKVYPAPEPIYKGEYIEYKMNADSNGRLYVPVAGIGTGGASNCSYSWKVSVDGGSETTYSGTGSSSGAIQLSGYTAGSNHTIKIVPTTEDYGWARAFGVNNVASKSYITEILYDGSYMGYAVSATNTGNYFRYYQYYDCTSLTKPADEYLPDTVTHIGSNFRGSQYNTCTSLTYTPIESLPDSVIEIGDFYRVSQYGRCSSLSEIKGWKDLSIGGNYYRYSQYYGISSNTVVTVLSDVGYSSYDSYALDNISVETVNVPSSYLNNYKNTSNNPRVGIDDSKFIGY